MKIIDRYLISHFLVPFCYSLLAFLILYVTHDLSINLDDFLKNKVAFSTLARYYFLNIPLIIVNSTPIAILLSLLYSLGNMNRHHEIVAMRASGIHIDRVLLPFLVLGVVFAILIFIINDQLVCGYSFEQSLLKEEIFEGHKANVSGIWKNIPFRNALSNRDWFIESFDFKKKELHNVVVREFGDNSQISRKVIAESCKWIDGQWLFLNGTIYYYTEDGLPRMSGDDSTQKPRHFSKMIMTYEETPRDFENSRHDRGEMNFRELLRYLTFQNKNSRLYQRIMVDLHYKIAFPFVCIIAVLVGIPFAVRTQRGGFINGIGICIIIFLAYYGISILFMTAGKNAMLSPALSVWIPNIIFLGFGVIAIKNAA